MEGNDSRHGFGDYLAYGYATVGVGFLPLAPGTFGSAIGVLIYVAACYLAVLYKGLMSPAACFAVVGIVFLAATLISFAASLRVSKLEEVEDPQIIVIDEVLGQLVTFVFVPFTLSWPVILIGFLLFRVFDIWKPFPVKLFERLPNGIGIIADDLVAGVYAGIVLSIIYALFF